MIYYFAYGSNLHPARMAHRISSAKLIGTARYLNHRLTFSKISIDGSSKCNMQRTDTDLDMVHGAIYSIDNDHKLELDIIEGNGYIDGRISLQYNKEEYECVTYLAQQSHIVSDMKPYHWYKSLVIMGARHLKFPESYIASIEAIESMDDLNHDRRIENEALIKIIEAYR